MAVRVNTYHRFKRASVKGLTLMEVLITLALTSIVVTMAYTGLNYIQKLHANYQQQTRFINSYSYFKKRLDTECLKAKTIIETTENEFLVQRDSGTVIIKFLPKTIITTHNAVTDTFFLEAKNITKNYQTIKNPLYAGKLVQSISFDCFYSKQKFIFYFYKAYDASTVLSLEDLTLLNAL